MESLVATIDETGPPPGVPIKKLQLVFDEAQGTAVVLQYFDNRRTCGPGPRPSPRWIRPRHRAAASRWTRASSRSSASSKPRSGLEKERVPLLAGEQRCLQCQRERARIFGDRREAM